MFLVNGFEGVNEFNVLGVRINNQLKVDSHISNLIACSAKSLYALRVLKSYGMPPSSIQEVFRSIVLQKLSYAAPSWWGLTTKQHRDKIEAFINKSKRHGYCNDTEQKFQQLVEKAENKLLKNIISNVNHSLYHLLPRPRNHGRTLRNATTNSLVIAADYDTRNFFDRLLIKTLI